MATKCSSHNRDTRVLRCITTRSSNVTAFLSRFQCDHGSLVDSAFRAECYKYCSPNLQLLLIRSISHQLLTTSHYHNTQTSQHPPDRHQSPCNSLPPSSLSPPAPPSSWPRPTLLFAVAESPSAARLMSLISLPSPARTVSSTLVFLMWIILTINQRLAHPRLSMNSTQSAPTLV
jgi:hypothetical protein